MNAIRDIFNEVQKSAQTHKLCVKKMAAAINSRGSEDQENITYFLNGGIDRILLHPGGGASMDRSVSFLGAFLATVEERVLFMTIQHICSRLQSSNKLVRQRVCQIACCALESLCEAKIEMSEALFTELSTSMVARLKDKVPAVRIAALKTLKYLQFPEAGEDECMVEIKRCMRCDSSASVRIAAVEALALTDETKHDMCARLKDVKSEVRVAVLHRLTAETDMRQFTVQMRAEILRAALEDREESVRAAVLGLIWKWLSLVDSSNIPKFLNLLNPSENEDAALLVGATIMEELIKSESTQHAKMKKAVKDSFFKWNVIAGSGSATSLTPSDVLWVQVRCSYARQFLPVFPASEICDALLPDAAVLCSVLKDLKATLVNPSAHHAKQSSLLKAQSVTKYLHNLAPLLIGATDVSGMSQLMEECADTFLNTSVTLPWEAVEAALRAYSELHAASAAEPSDGMRAHRVVLVMTTQLRAQMAVIEANASAEDATEDGMSAEVAKKVVLAMTERCLQLTHWAMQQELSFAACKPAVAEAGEGEEEDVADNSVVQEALPFVLESLQRPQYQLRFLAVGCLGLICLVDSKLCDAYRGLILQVASGDFEDPSIRAQALQCLVDFSAVYRGKLIDDNDLGNVLLRMQESGEPESMLVAAEAAAKLLHSGTHHEPRLFANLLKFFFLTESLPDASAPAGKLKSSTGNEEEDLAAAQEEYEHRLFLANCARLQQILSIFFHVFTTSDVIADQVVAEAIPYLVADMTNEIKDGTVDASALAKILKHLFSLCENKASLPAAVPSEVPDADEDGEAIEKAGGGESGRAKSGAEGGEAMLNLVRATTAAALSKELLKLGSSKVEKAIDKEFIKLLSTLSFECWITQYDVAAVERVIDTITLCSSHDRTATKHLDLLMQVCTTPSLHTAHATRSTVPFADLAPGLTDLIELAARSSVLDQSMDEGASFFADEGSVNGMSSLPGSAVKPRHAPRNPLSAVKAPAPTKAPAARPTRVSSARKPRARPSYAERDSESEEEDLEEEDEDADADSAADQQSDSDGDAASEEESSANVPDINQAMSPTKNFILTSKGKAGGGRASSARASKAAAGKKIAVQLVKDDDDEEGGGKGAASKRKAPARGRGAKSSDENAIPN